MCYVAPPATPLNPIAPLTVGEHVVSPYGAAGHGLQPHVEPYVPTTDAERAAWREFLARFDAAHTVMPGRWDAVLPPRPCRPLTP